MGAAQPYDQVKSASRNVLLRKKVQEVIGGLRKEAKIEILDEDLKKFAEEAAKQRKLIEDKQSGQISQPEEGAAAATEGDAGSASDGKGDLQQ
jgi:hypothetical protein